MMIQQSNEPALSVKMLQVSGPDAGKFLQGQFTCDVLRLQPGQETLGAYCNIKGKVDSLFTLQFDGENYFLYMQPELIEPTLQELKKYAVFSKVSLAITEKSAPVRDAEQEILAKIPELYPQTVGLFFPHDINLPTLGAVSFTKGCYRGQEIVARMQHRGNLKRSLYIFRTKQVSPAPGQEVHTTEHILAGTVVRTILSKEGSTLGLVVLTDSFSHKALYVAEAALELLR